MAQLTIDIPDDKVDIIRDAFADEYGWKAGSGMTKTAHVKYQMIQYIKHTVRNNLANKAANTARSAKESEVNSIDIT